MMLPASSNPAATYVVEPFPFQAPQPHISFPYQAPPSRSTLVPKPDALIQVALVTPPTDFHSEAETKHERKMKMEEAINDLQAGASCLKSGDTNWNLIPGKLFPLKTKILDSHKYDGIIDPPYHLHYYQGNISQYRDYKEPTAGTSSIGGKRHKNMTVNAVNLERQIPQHY
ncbi:hypothetical protein CDL15_Pgr000874 [Punica granatum]|uniref:Uncharacterized protein n=1 Tax=Punica granatum TaxID=22663 RepID=A0A218XYF3_PUNGR|nr:hypothetical protein CDL15_Pgr000874 [Punica granatum]